MKTLEVSIITPALNEEAIISGFVEKAIAFLHKNKISGEVIVVENGSTDGTYERVKNLTMKFRELRVAQIPFGDKGRALAKGMEMSRGKFLITIDTDLWDDNFVQQSLEKLQLFDVVVGSRAVDWGADQRPISSRLLNIGYNYLFKLVFNLQGTNTHAQLSFRRDKILPLVKSCKTGALNFDTELIIRAERAGLSKVEVPVIVKETRARRYSILKQLTATVKNFFIMLRTLGPSPDWSYVLLFVALIIGALMRFYEYPGWFFFSVDEELNSFMTWMISSGGHLPAIGGPISGTSLYMAPWFLYFNALWFFLSGGNVIFSGLIMATIELLTIFLVYLVGKRLFSPRVGAISSFLYAVSLLMAIFDRHYWNITLVPVITMMTLYALLNYLSGRRRWLPIAAVTVAFGLSTTFSTFALFVFSLLVLIFFRKNNRGKDLTFFLGIIGLFHIPPLIFELRHNFQLTRGLWTFLTSFSRAGVPLFNRIDSTISLALTTFAKSIAITSPIDLSDESSICTELVSHFNPPTFFVLVSIIILLYGLWKMWQLRSSSSNLKIVWILVATNLLALMFFHSEEGERHFLLSLPIFFIFLGAFLGEIYSRGARQKIFVDVVIIAVATSNLFSLFNSHSSYGISDKIRAVKYVIANTTANQFYLDSIGDCHKWGYRYLFTNLGHEPAGSYLDPDFSWMYQFPPHPQDARVKATIIAPNKNVPEPDWLRAERAKQTINSSQNEKFGNIEVYLRKY